MIDLSNGHSTHRPFLQNELNNLNKDKKCLILELGVGYGSSPLFYQHCLNNPNHFVLGFETDQSWFLQIKQQYQLPNYKFEYILEWNNLDSVFIEEKYDLVFVDQSPWEARINSIDNLKNKSNLIILHDYDYFNKIESGFPKEKCDDIFKNNSSSWLYQKYSNDFILEDNYIYMPPTLIMRKK